MKKSENRFWITEQDIELLRQQTIAEQPQIELAESFLGKVSAPDRSGLTPEILMAFGQSLGDPDQLLAGPNILLWQNIRRWKGRL